MSATTAVELHAGNAVWTLRKPPLVTFASPRTHHTEVLIIGTGITGALAADALSTSGMQVMLVDKRKLLTGASSVSTALLQAELDTPMLKLSAMVGHHKAVRHVQRSKLALRALAERLTRMKIDCDLTERDSLYLSGELMDAQDLEREMHLRRAAGLEATFVTRGELKKLYGLRRAGALLTQGNFSADPVRVTAGVLNTVFERKGTSALLGVEVVEVVEHARGVDVALSDGSVVKAGYVVYATGYELPEEVSTVKHKRLSTWAIATAPQKKTWHTECLIWEAADPYLYLRTTPEGRVICGGEDEEFLDEERRDALLEKKSATLARKLKQLMPWLKTTPEYAWCGTFGATPTGTPSIGFIPGKKRTLTVLGYGGNGFTFAMLAAQLISGLICRGDETDADLYAVTSASSRSA